MNLKDIAKYLSGVIAFRSTGKDLSEGSLRVYNDAVIFRVGNGRICGKKFIVLESISSTLSDVKPEEIQYILKSYYNALNLGFPIEVKTILKPLESDDYVKKIDKRIEKLSVVLELNPSSESLRTKITELSKLKSKIVREGFSPYEVITYFAVSACSNDLDELTKTLDVRIKVLRDTLSSLGIKTKILKFKRLDMISKLFFRFTITRKLELSSLLKPLKLVGHTLFFTIPSIIASVTHNEVTSGGIFLGVDVLSGKKVFWNLSIVPSPHVVVVGPTGSGKTEFLSILSYRITEGFPEDIRVVIFDVKGEYRERIERFTNHFKELRLGLDLGLGINYVLNILPYEAKLNFLMDLMNTILPRDSSKDTMPIIYRAINYVVDYVGKFQEGAHILDKIAEYISDFEDPYVGYRISRIIKVMKGLDRGMPLIKLLSNIKGKDIVILNLSSSLSLGISYVSLISDILVKVIEVFMSLIKKPSRIPKTTLALILDEGWTLVDSEGINELIRLSRSYGILLALASQRPEDFSSSNPTILFNAGLLAAMPSLDMDYWNRVSRYVTISEDMLKKLPIILSRDEALIRIAPNPRPYLVRFSIYQ